MSPASGFSYTLSHSVVFEINNYGQGNKADKKCKPKEFLKKLAYKLCL